MIQPSSMQAWEKNSFLDAGNASYLEYLYQMYLTDPSAISPAWREYFASTLQPQMDTVHSQKQIAIDALIESYRLLGHLHADLDPLKMQIEPLVPELMLSYYHITKSDLNDIFDSNTLFGQKTRSLKQILEDLQKIYCKTIASEYMHISDSPERVWVQLGVERLFGDIRLSKEEKINIMERLIAAEGLEKYLGAKYPGAKRFSIEGCDSLIIALDALIFDAGKQGIEEVVMGMAHRGRLNVLVNILGKRPRQLFNEFEGKHDEKLESGDVKYHQGFSCNIATSGENLHLTLAFNPSHLEMVAPVVCGSVRARQELRQDHTASKVLSVAMHGDAAFSGQGVIMETLNMSQTHGFSVGGTVHIIINNQIGFTTSDPREARSTLYCSDIGKMMGIPIFHVNADDPEAVHVVSKFALAYKTKFKKDVIIDLVGYRRHGHNEADEPSATQPLMYQMIRKLPTVCTIYGDKLKAEGTLTAEKLRTYADTYRGILDKQETSVLMNLVDNVASPFASNWEPYFTKDWRIAAKTAVDETLFKTLGEKMHILPQGFVLQTQVQKIIDARAKMTAGELPIDWGCAEMMAYACLVQEGYHIRMSGQDCQRGTFFHRQAVLHNQVDGAEYTPLQHLGEVKGKFNIYNSLLSEEAVLGFEYGYSSKLPNSLVIWEAQFGDFANNAQGVIDQFISSAEQKWGRLSGLTLFLPQGYEGQGPEHSSARLERYLQLCAEHNMQVCMPSSPSQMFHMLRRQMLRPMRKPLIVITPKSLLRHKLAVSSLSDFSQGKFFAVLDEIDNIAADTVKRVILCGGKIYYELLEARRAKNIQGIVIIRIEQLYPYPDLEAAEILARYKAAKDVVWCQEEPQNQGAWYSIMHHLQSSLAQSQTLKYVGRKAAAAPAVGYGHLHQVQQETLIQEALT